jgi:hypothetical protein
VDDMIVTDYVDLANCTQAMEQWQAYGFYLRLGKNITFCYMSNTPSPLPPGKEVSENLFLWKFADACPSDWNYPNNTDMTIYRKRDIKACLKSYRYTNPNTLEIKWSRKKDLQRCGLCFHYSKNINIPLNIVTTTLTNRHMNLYTVEQLLSLFQEGKKIDITQFHCIRNPSPHVAYQPQFTSR